VIDRLTGEPATANRAASNFTYAQATWTQGLADRISGHVGALDAIGGVPALLVPDDTKVAVVKDLPLRSAAQSQLGRDGGALRHRHSTGAAAQAGCATRRTRQGSPATP